MGHARHWLDGLAGLGAVFATVSPQAIIGSVAGLASILWIGLQIYTHFKHQERCPICNKRTLS
jgi:hypothetical protein